MSLNCSLAISLMNSRLSAHSTTARGLPSSGSMVGTTGGVEPNKLGRTPSETVVVARGISLRHWFSVQRNGSILLCNHVHSRCSDALMWLRRSRSSSLSPATSTRKWRAPLIGLARLLGARPTGDHPPTMQFGRMSIVVNPSATLSIGVPATQIPAIRR